MCFRKEVGFDEGTQSLKVSQFYALVKSYCSLVPCLLNQHTLHDTILLCETA